MKITSLILLMLILAFPKTGFTTEISKGTITGEVIDRDTKQEIIGAVIEVLNAKIFTATDVHGNFTIDGLDPKTYNLKINT